MKKLSTLPSVSDLLAEGYTEVKTSSGQSIYQKVDIKDKPSDGSGTGNAGTEGAGTEGTGSSGNSSEISQEAKVEVRPKSITVTPEREVAAGETVEVQVSVEPADLVAGMKVSVKSTGVYSTLDKEELVLDDNGKAIVVITGNAPGTDYLTFTIADSQLQAQMSLNVIEDLTCKHEKAPIVEKEDPTCTTPGYLREKCPDCGELLNEETYAATGHKAVSDAAAPATCTETGKTAGTHCSVCGEVLTAQTIIAAKGHTWGEWNTVTAATALKTGTMSRKLPIPLQIKKWQ